MDETALRVLIDRVRAGELDTDEAVRRLRRLPFVDLGFARVDHHRTLRLGVPEAVYAPGKSAQQCSAIVSELLAEDGGGPVVLSRADPSQVDRCLADQPGGVVTTGPQGATVVWRAAARRDERVVVVTAGTSDLPVAEECRATLAAFGVDAHLLADVGVAGAHRLFASIGELTAAHAVVVVAGMEGALASLVGGVTSGPVVAVPTSAGYGSALDGVTALLAMTASCAAGVSVVGIDNGFGAAFTVARILGPAAGPGGEQPSSALAAEEAGSTSAPGELGRRSR
jgi:NCAIR mutase (PurE)-related protein